MKIKKLLPIALFSVLAASCEDKIDERYSPATPPAPARTVLVEEYTGSNCSNCPAGHEVMEQIENHYNTEENVANNIGIITVGIHIPNWGATVETGGFITPEAAALTPGGVNPPQAQVNRSGRVLGRSEWGKEISLQLGREPEVTFPDRVTASVSANTLEVKGVVRAPQNIGEARLNVWIVEDGIVYRQLMPDGSRDDAYVHKNVYRAHMTKSVTGDDFPMSRNEDKTFMYTSPLHQNWNAANLRVIVFVETPTKGVLNATQAPVIAYE